MLSDLYSDAPTDRDAEPGFLARDILRFIVVDIILSVFLILFRWMGFFAGPAEYAAGILVGKMLLLAYLVWLIRDRRDAYPVVALLEDLQDDGKIPMGGIGIYNTVGGDHEVTMHLDMRGHRATWGYLTDARGRRSEFAWQSVRFAELDRHEEDLAAERARKDGRPYSRPRREPLQ